MYEQLAALYHKMERIPAVYWLGRRYLHGGPAGNAAAYLRLAKLRSRKEREPRSSTAMNVVFVQQHKMNWDIVRCLYERMADDERFDVSLVAVEEPHDEDHDAAYRMLVELYGTDAVIKAEQPDGLFDLKALKPDCVFLPRPYDQYLPKPYRSSSVSGYAAVAHVPYGADFFSDVDDDCMNGRFYRNVSFFFADCERVAAIQRDRYPRGHGKGIMRTAVTGLPYLSSYAQLETAEHDSFNVMWTPRWGEEATLGGSSFMPLKDKLVAYIDSKPEYRLLFRPHPFMFEHFVSTGRLAQGDVEAYLARFSEGGKYRYDTAPDLYGSFSESDVLVTDVSSIIAPYLVTGKPVILCDTGAHLSDLGEAAAKVMYRAGDAGDVMALLEIIGSGEDPLRDARLSAARDLFLPHGDDPSEAIMDILAGDVPAAGAMAR